MAIPNTKLRDVQSGGVAASTAFGISTDDSAHIMTILRDTLYSDKILAVLREYSANAWDAHRDAGKADVPIVVTIPTMMAPTLSIKDFGPGLSHEDVFQVYTQYGKSTKRTSASTVGQLGIGSKSAFAYSDSFTVVSSHGGVRRTYVAVLDPSEKGEIKLLLEEPYDGETGIEIQVAVKTSDVLEFTSKARELFQYFHPRPAINIDLPPAPNAQAVLANGSIYESADNYSHSWVAVMGCIAYKINLDQIMTYKTDAGEMVGDYLQGISGALYFNIGEVQIVASREELKYNNSTKAAIVKRFNLLVDEFVKHTLDNIENGNFTPWEKRLRAQVLTSLRLPVPKQLKSITEEYVTLKKELKTCSMTRNKNLTGTVTINRHVRIVIRDDDRAVRGFYLGEYDYLVRRLDDKAPLADTVKEIEEALEAQGLTGVPIVYTSTLAWNMPIAGPVAPSKDKNKKHLVSVFKLKPDEQFHYPWSRVWDIAEHSPSKDDIFVVISAFKPVGYTNPYKSSVSDFYSLFDTDYDLAKLFGKKLPKIIGYKTTDKKPVAQKDCLGKEYREWRADFATYLLKDNPKLQKLLDHWEWAQEIHNNNAWRRVDDKTLKKLAKQLGKGHPILKMLTRQQVAYKITKKLSHQFHVGLKNLLARAKDEKTETQPALALAAIYKTYPLLGLSSSHGLDRLWKDEALLWIEYIKLVDDKHRRDNP